MTPFRTIKVNINFYLSQSLSDSKELMHIRNDIEEKIKDRVFDYCCDNNLSIAHFGMCLETKND